MGHVGWAVVMALLVILNFATPGAADTGDIRAQRLGPGDRITVIVFGQKELNGDFTVDSTATFSSRSSAPSKSEI